MSRAIIFREELRGGARHVFVENEWPLATLIAPGMLRVPLMTIDEFGLIIITCANGSATYRLAKEQLSDDAITVDLVKCTYRHEPRQSEHSA